MVPSTYIRISVHKFDLQKLIFLPFQVPSDRSSERRTDDDASVHDQILWVMHKSGMEDLLLYVASAENETQYCLHVLEIVSLMFREQVN